MQDRMTIFYSKKTGKVKACCGGVQTMNYFGDDQYDYNYSIFITDYDINVILNFYMFKIENEKLIYVDNSSDKFSKYMEEK